MKAVVFNPFRGLDFRRNRIGGTLGALIAHNVLVVDGKLRRRAGAEQFGTFTTSGTPETLWCHNASQLLVGQTSTRVDAVTSAGSIANSAVRPRRFTRFGTPTSNRTIFVITGGASTPRQWDGAAFSTPTFTNPIPAVPPLPSRTGITPTGALGIAVTPWDNRVVYMGAGTATTNVHQLYFSEPGDAYSVDINNNVLLNPGDGDSLQEIIAWRDMLFVFKGSRYFIFTGTSTDSTGGPVFNYRTVNANVGASAGGSSTRIAAIAHRTGVYFIADSGTRLMRTRGGEPEAMDDSLAQILETSDLIPAGGKFPSQLLLEGLGCDDRFVYVTTNIQTELCLDTTTGEWTSTTVGEQEGPYAFYERVPFLFWGRVSDNRIMRYSWRSATPESITTEIGVSIDAQWRSAWVDLGDAGVEKEIRDTVAHGYGLIQLGWLRDYGSAVTSAVTLTLGSYAAKTIDKAHTVRAERAALYALEITNTGQSGGFFEVDRVETYVREMREPGQRT